MESTNNNAQWKSATVYIKHQQTVLQYMLILFYNLIKKVLMYTSIDINDIYYSSFFIKSVKFKSNDQWYVSKKPFTLYLFDNCFCINNFKIYYEYLIVTQTSEKYVHMVVYASLNCSDTSLSFNIGDNVMSIVLETKYTRQLTQTIKKNMHYHILYNQINKYVVYDVITKHKDILKEYKI
jgi:hypothetical protein